MGHKYFQKPIFAKFVIAGKYMGPILGQKLVNGWVSFNFPSGTSLPKKVMSYPPPLGLQVDQSIGMGFLFSIYLYIH